MTVFQPQSLEKKENQPKRPRSIFQNFGVYWIGIGIQGIWDVFIFLQVSKDQACLKIGATWATASCLEADVGHAHLGSMATVGPSILTHISCGSIFLNMALSRGACAVWDEKWMSQDYPGASQSGTPTGAELWKINQGLRPQWLL